MKIFDMTYNAYCDKHEDAIEEAIDYAKGMVWSEVESSEQDIKYKTEVGECNGVTVYYDYGADYFFFEDNE